MGMNDRTYCSSPAWQHAPQVLPEVAVDGAETLTLSTSACMAASTKNVCSPSVWRIGSCTLNTDGPLETPADSPASDVADVLTNQSADTRARLILAHIIGSCLSHIYHRRGAAWVSHIRWRCDDARRSFGHALSSVSLLADRPPWSALVPATTFLFL